MWRLPSTLRGIRRPTVDWGCALALVLACTGGAFAVEPPRRTASAWCIDQRVVSLDQADGQVWQLDYRLRNTSGAPRVLSWSQIQCDVDGWVSNSRASGHSHPRTSKLHWARPSTPADAEILASRDQANQCHERGTFEVWPAARGYEPPDAALGVALRIAAPLSSTTLAIPAGETLCVRVRLKHDHFLCGDYEPLLGTRTVALRLDDDLLVDEVALEGPIRASRRAPSWPALDPPAERRDTHVYLSPPDSLYLAAHLPGQGYYRTMGPVRYSTRMRVSFSYLLAPESHADAVVRITQLKQGPALWKPLNDGQREICLTTAGRWTRVERVFRTEDEATTMTLEFRISGELGDLWIEDVRVEPVQQSEEGP